MEGNTAAHMKASYMGASQHEDRVLPNPVQHVWTTPMRKAAAAAGNADQMALWAGQGADRIHSILTVKEMMNNLTHTSFHDRV